MLRYNREDIDIPFIYSSFFVDSGYLQLYVNTLDLVNYLFDETSCFPLSIEITPTYKLKTELEYVGGSMITTEKPFILTYRIG